MRDDIDNVNRYFMPPRLLRKRPSKAKLKRLRRKRLIRRFITLSVIVIAVVTLAVLFTNAGGSMILGLAKNYVSEKMNLNLKIESVTGNPLKGYSMRNVKLEDKNGKKILSAEALSGHLSLSSFLKGIIRYSKISMENVSMDFDAFLYPALTKAEVVPLDRIIIRNSKFNSRAANLNVSVIDADLRRLDADIDADINGVPLIGTIDMGELAGFTAMNRGDMYLGSGKITLTGGLFDDVIDVHATAEDLNLKEITGIFHDELSSGDFDGTLNLNLDVNGTRESVKLSGSIDYKGTEIYGFPVERMSANYNYIPDDEILTLNNIQASALNIPLQGEITALKNTSGDTELRIKLDGSESNLEGLDDVLSMPELKSLGGKIESLNVNINGTMKSLNGLVNLIVPKITYNGRTLQNLRMQMKLSNSSTGNVEGKFGFENANGFINGTIEPFLRDSKMNLTVKIADIDIKRIENMIPDYPTYNLEGKITLSLGINGSKKNPVVTGSLSSNEFSVRSQKVMKPVINFRIEDRTLTTGKTEGTLDGKPIAITGTMKPFPSSNPELDINAEGIKITGPLNNPSVIFMASEDIKDESKDTELKIESQIESEDVNTESPDKKIESQDIKEETSKDENASN